MKNIRTNVFETNSSSSHSITINVSADGEYETIAPDESGNIILNGGNFSVIDFYIQSPITKANAIAAYCVLSGDKELEKTFEEVLVEHTGAKGIVNNVKLIGPDCNSYMASWFVKYLMEALYSKEAIKNFIFNTRSNIGGSIGWDG